MSKPITKLTPAGLVHRPSSELDIFADYVVATPAWIVFDEKISVSLDELEQNNRQYWIPQAVRKSLGR